MVMLPRPPRISSLSDAQIEKLESFIEKYGLEIELGKRKTASFIFKLWKEEEAKRERGEKYSRKLLRDAEKLILKISRGGLAQKRAAGAPPQPVKRRRGKLRAVRPLEAVPREKTRRGQKMVELKKEEMEKAEYNDIKRKAKKYGQGNDEERTLYLMEGYLEGRPFLSINGDPFSILEHDISGVWELVVGRSPSGGIEILVPEEMTREIDFKRLAKAEGKILLLSPRYLATVYRTVGNLSAELKELKEALPGAEIHITGRDFSMLRIGLGEDQKEELEELRRSGKIDVEYLSLEWKDDAYEAYKEMFGELYEIASIERIGSYRRILAEKFKPSEEKKLSSTEIPMSRISFKDVLNTFLEMGFEQDSARKQAHSKYVWYVRETPRGKQSVQLPAGMRDIDRPYLGRILKMHGVSTREFSETWKRVHRK